MTDGFTCTDKETLIAYLYEECDPAERRLVESHLAGCGECAREIESFGGVRAALASWAPPEQATGFRIVAEEAVQAAEGPPAVVLRPVRWWQAPMPGLMRAAAAILLFAGGAAVANLEVRYDKDGLVVRTGWLRHDVQQAQAPVAVPATAPAAAVPWRADLASLERRLTDRFDQRLVSSTPATEPGGASGVRPLDERVFLSRVQDLIAQSEQRTQREMAYRISELSGEMTAQRIADLRRMEATGVEALQNRQMINYLLTVSQKK